MRSAKQSENFPYRLSTMCYFEVYNDGRVSHLPHKNKCDLEEVNKAYLRALEKETTLYAVWPGNWRSDLFIIDDLNKFKESFDL